MISETELLATITGLSKLLLETEQRADASHDLANHNFSVACRHEQALRSIANNSCCGSCQEAANVAKAALSYRGDSK